MSLSGCRDAAEVTCRQAGLNHGHYGPSCPEQWEGRREYGEGVKGRLSWVDSEERWVAAKDVVEGASDSLWIGLRDTGPGAGASFGGQWMDRGQPKANNTYRPATGTQMDRASEKCATLKHVNILFASCVTKLAHVALRRTIRMCIIEANFGTIHATTSSSLSASSTSPVHMVRVTPVKSPQGSTAGSD